MTLDNWDLEFILPDLVLDKAYDLPLNGGSILSFAPVNDPRVTTLRQKHNSIDEFLEHFIDGRKNKIQPVVLIYNNSFGKQKLSIESIVSFRNILALSVLFPERSNWGPYANPEYLWSDSFDFYPFTISEDNRLIMNAPGVNVFSSTGFLQKYGMTAPHLFRPTIMNYLPLDTYIYDALCKCWENNFVQKSNDIKLAALFRSLEIAYSALSSPKKNQESIFDYGLSIIKWVSAVEILIHPANNNSSEELVRNFIEKIHWTEKLLNYPDHLIKVKNNTIKVNLIQFLYHRLNRARNDFAHGNPINNDNLYPFGTGKPSIINLAPTIYRCALYKFLELYSGHSTIQYSSLNLYVQNNLYEDLLVSLVKENIGCDL